MKRKIGVAAALALIAAGAFATGAFAQCFEGFYFKFDADCFAFEDNYTPATFHSAPGSQLVVVGKVSQFCAPFADLDASDPAKEYTFIWAGMTSTGSTHVPIAGGATRHQTDYNSGVFLIYEDTSVDAPTATGGMPPSPPNGTVPSSFVDGTEILSGTLFNFVTTVTRFSNGTFATSFRGDYQFTGPVGGTYYSRVAGSLPDVMGGLWCAEGTANGLCDLPAGYSSHPNGKFDGPPVTPTSATTWGAIKQMYR
jgi:hypothetical protein